MAGRSGESIESTVKKLRATITSLNNNLAIYENDMARIIKELKDTYGIESIEAGIEMVQNLDAEIERNEAELGEIAQKISHAMEKYNG